MKSPCSSTHAAKPGCSEGNCCSTSGSFDCYSFGSIVAVFGCNFGEIHEGLDDDGGSYSEITHDFARLVKVGVVGHDDITFEGTPAKYRSLSFHIGSLSSKLSFPPVFSMIRWIEPP